MDKRTSPDLFYGPQFKRVPREISHLAVALNIDVKQEGEGERFVHNDDTVCGRRNDDAFRQLREHLIALYELAEKSLERLCPGELRGELGPVWGAVLGYRKGDQAEARES